MDGYEMGLRLCEIRKSKGLKSQKEFADALAAFGKDISREKVKNWECGERAIKAEDLLIISKCLDVSVDYILGVADNPSIQGSKRESADYTGLSEDAVEILHGVKVSGDTKETEFTSVTKNINAPYLETLSEIIASTSFFDLIEKCTICIDQAKKLKENPDVDDAKTVRYMLYDISDVFREIINYIYPVDQTVREAHEIAKDKAFSDGWDEEMQSNGKEE